MSHLVFKRLAIGAGSVLFVFLLGCTSAPPSGASSVHPPKSIVGGWVTTVKGTVQVKGKGTFPFDEFLLITFQQGGTMTVNSNRHAVGQGVWNGTSYSVVEITYDDKNVWSGTIEVHATHVHLSPDGNTLTADGVGIAKDTTGKVVAESHTLVTGQRILVK